MRAQRRFLARGSRLALALVLGSTGTAAAQPAPSYMTVAQAWSGVAPCLARPIVEPEARREHLAPYLTGAPRIDARVAGFELRNQAVPLVEAFRQLTRRLEKQVEAGEVRVTSPCRDVNCAATALFGPEAAPRLLHLALAHRYVASQHGEFMTQSWTAAELDEVTAAVDDLPPSLLPLDRNQFRALAHRHDREKSVQLQSGLRGEAVAFAGDGHPGIVVTEAWHGLPRTERRAALVHEMAHEFLRIRGRTVDWRALWGGAVEADRLAMAGRGGASFVSAYAQAGGLEEDFAESFVAYRYMAPALRRTAPSRYALLRDWAFDGLEYGQAARCRPAAARTEAIRVLALRDASALQPDRRLGAYVTERCRPLLDARDGETAGRRRACFIRAAFEDLYRRAWDRAGGIWPGVSRAVLDDVVSRSLFMELAAAGLPFPTRDRLWRGAALAADGRQPARAGTDGGASVPVGD